MIWKEIEEMFGRGIADKMKKELKGVTVTIDNDGVEHYHKSDVLVALMVVTTGYKPSSFEWD